MPRFCVFCALGLLMCVGCSSDHTLAVASELAEDAPEPGPTSESTEPATPIDPEQCQGGGSMGIGAVAGCNSPDEPGQATSCSSMHEQVTGGPNDSLAVACTRGNTSEEWTCVCTENEVDVKTVNLPFDAPLGGMNEEPMLEACGWPQEFMRCFYAFCPIEVCRAA